MKPFSKWTIEEVEEEFQIVLEQTSERLKTWMEVQSLPSETEEKSIALLGEKLRASVWDWNEEELKIYVTIQAGKQDGRGSLEKHGARHQEWKCHACER